MNSNSFGSRCLYLLSSFLLVSPVTHAGNWPCWRGPSQDGTVSESNLPLQWNKEHNVHWKIAIPGIGYSSPIIWESTVFLTTCVLEDETRHLLKIDRESGAIDWDRVVAKSPIEPMHRDNTPASATPCTDGRLVYVTFIVHGQLWVAAYDFDGQQAWERSLGGFESAHGFSTSLILDENRLIVSGLQDGPDALVSALDKTTGETLWRVPRPRQIRSFSSPFLCRVADSSIVILSGAEQTIAYDSATGATLWTVSGPAEKTVSSLVYCAESKLAFAAGGRDNNLLAISLDEATQQLNGQTAPQIAWRANQGIPYMTSPLVSQGRLHVLSDEGVYRCYDCKTGKVLKQLRAVGPVRSSMFATKDRIYITEQSGRTTVVANNEKWEVLAVNDLDEQVLASSAISNGDIVIRTTASLFLIRDKAL